MGSFVTGGSWANSEIQDLRAQLEGRLIDITKLKLRLWESEHDRDNERRIRKDLMSELEKMKAELEKMKKAYEQIRPSALGTPEESGINERAAMLEIDP